MSGEAPALPLDLQLRPVSRRPLVLPPETVRWALEREVGTGPGRAPEASVVVVTHDNLPVTRLCLESVLGEEGGPSFEVIVVDNGSTDPTPEVLSHVAAKHSAVRIIANDENLGFAAAVNLGLSAARSDALVILNNDVVVTPGWLGRLLRVLAQDDVGMVGPVTNAAPNEARVPAPYETYGQLLEHAERRWQERGEAAFDIAVLTMFCVALRGDVYRAVGPLDEQFELGLFEDDDYARRVRAAGYRLVCADGVYVHHFGEASFGDLVPTGQYGELFRRNRQLFERKWGVAWVPHQGREEPEYQRMIQRICELVEEKIPRGSTLLVVSKGDEALVVHRDRTAWHFPRGADGGYAGHHPADAAAVIDELTHLRRAGATHLVLPQTSRWWLEHYAGLDDQLRSWSDEIIDDEFCTIFRLRPDV